MSTEQHENNRPHNFAHIVKRVFGTSVCARAPISIERSVGWTDQTKRRSEAIPSDSKRSRCGPKQKESKSKQFTDLLRMNELRKQRKSQLVSTIYKADP